jgi:hypothetical protein
VDSVVHQEEIEMAIKQPGILASPNRALALTVGAVLALWGIMGFLFAGEGGHHFFGADGGYLWDAFLVNPALAFIWTALAAALLIVGMDTVLTARGMNILVGIVLLVIGVYGFVFKNTDANVLAANTTDNVFHVVVGAILLLTALGADKQNLRALRGADRVRV